MIPDSLPPLAIRFLFSALALAACSDPGSLANSPEKGVRTSTLSDDSLGLSLAIPAGWTGSLSVERPLRMLLTRQTLSEFRASVAVAAEPQSGTAPMPAILEGMVEAKRQAYGGDFLLGSVDTASYGRNAGGEIRYQLLRGGTEFQARQFVLLRQGGLVVVTCLDTKAAFAASEDDFDAILSGLAFR